MRGHVRKRSTWEYILELGDQPAQRCTQCRKRFWTDSSPLKTCPACGGDLRDVLERRQAAHAGFKTKKAAETELNDALGAVQQGVYIFAPDVTLADFMRDEWLPAIRATVRPTTYRSYEMHLDRHIEPYLGTIPLRKLTGGRINGLYADLQTRGRAKKDPKDEDKGLSPATVRRVHAVLHRALRDAVRWNRLIRNPVDAADPPKQGRAADAAELKVWSAKELRTFLEAVREDRLYALWLTFATTGMRRGEVLGLRWQDVDLRAGRLSVSQTRVAVGYSVGVSEPKTRRGRRSVALDPGTVRDLRRWRRRQREERLEWGAAWTDTGYVFTREDGQPIHPDRVSKIFETEQARLKLPRLRLHDLRHTHATLALAAGIHPKIVSERLGHANISITLDTYSHVVPALEEEAASTIAALVIGKPK